MTASRRRAPEGHKPLWTRKFALDLAAKKSFAVGKFSWSLGKYIELPESDPSALQQVIETSASGSRKICLKSLPFGQIFLEEKEEVVESQVKAPTREYTIKKGDTLWKIAQKELGSGYRWKYLYEINKDKIKNPNMLKPGKKIILPVE